MIGRPLWMAPQFIFCFLFPWRCKLQNFIRLQWTLSFPKTMHEKNFHASDAYESQIELHRCSNFLTQFHSVHNIKLVWLNSSTHTADFDPTPTNQKFDIHRVNFLLLEWNTRYPQNFTLNSRLFFASLKETPTQYVLVCVDVCREARTRNWDDTKCLLWKVEKFCCSLNLC